MNHIYDYVMFPLNALLSAAAAVLAKGLSVTQFLKWSPPQKWPYHYQTEHS